ncbi:MAG: amidohydrolase family protein [Verrucomicrobiota bacterium]
MIDAHHHLWVYSQEEYAWIPEGSPLTQDFLLLELEAATKAAGVEGTVAVQARQSLEESGWLLELADKSDAIKGVVGWAPLIEENVATSLAPFASQEKFKGVRHVLQGEPDEYFLRDDFHRGLSLLPGLDLSYDLLLVQRQLPVATQLVDRQPNLPIIVDHIAKPEIQPGRVEPEWTSQMRELARRDNIIGVKFSGVVTEFPDDTPIDPDTIHAYFEESLNIFGSDRLMFGTDWPVCLLRIDDYRNWADTVRSLASPLSEDEQSQILTTNCQNVYHL